MGFPSCGYSSFSFSLGDVLRRSQRPCNQRENLSLRKERISLIVKVLLSRWVGRVGGRCPRLSKTLARTRNELETEHCPGITMTNDSFKPLLGAFLLSMRNNKSGWKGWRPRPRGWESFAPVPRKKENPLISGQKRIKGHTHCCATCAYT